MGADIRPVCFDRESIVEFKVLSPRKMCHPFLRYKRLSKQKFPPYSACADTMNPVHCTHSDEERCIVVTCVVDEILKAVEMGYGVMDVFEVWDYEVTCFDKYTNT